MQIQAQLMMQRTGYKVIGCILFLAIIFLPSLSKTFADEPSETPYISWSPDGTMLAVGSGTSVQIVDPVNMQVLNTLADIGGQTTEGAWNSDSTRLAVESEDGIEIWQTPENPTSAHIILNIPAFTGIIDGISWSPADSRLADAAGETIEIWNTTTGENIRTITGVWGSLTDLIWTPDERLALASVDPTVRIVNPTGQLLTNYYASNAIPVPPVTAIALSPDGNRMAIGAAELPILIWGNTRTGNVNAQGQLWERIPQMVLSGGVQGWDVPLSISWNSTGQYIASGATDGTVRIWDAATGDELQVIQVGTNTNVNSVAWSPDGAKLAYGGADGTVEIISAPEATEQSSAETPLPTSGTP